MMKRKLMKALSALFAACFILSVLPTAAFAADPPVLQSALVTEGGSAVELTFDKEMSAPVSGSAGFEAVRSDTVVRQVTAAGLKEGDKTKIVLTLQTTIKGGEVFSLKYTPGTVQSADGDALDAISSFAVTNDLPHPTLSSDSPPSGTAGTPYAFTFTATGGTGPYGFYCEMGSLPSGLTLDNASGVLSGTPTQAETAIFTIMVVDQNIAVDSREYSITIGPAAQSGVCEIDGIQYATLDDALGAVDNGQTIKLLADITDNDGMVINNGKIFTIDLDGHTLTVSNSSGIGLWVKSGHVDYTGSGEFNVTGTTCGVSADGGGASATVTTATATADGGNGAVAINGGDIVVNGNAQGGYNGVSVANLGSTAIVNGNATGTASDSSGAMAGFGASVTINGGTAQGVMYGAYANGSGSVITINGGNAIGTGSYSHGAHTEASGAIHVTGNVQGTQYGVVSGIDCSVVVTGNVTVTAEVNGFGVDAERGGTIEIGGNVVANGSSLGAFATSEAEITIDGAILASNYIQIFDDINEVPVYKDGSESSRTTPTTKEGYYTYSAGTSTVWVKDAGDTTPPVWTAGYPFVFNVMDTDLVLRVSADESCTVYYVVLADGAEAPSSEQVENGRDAGGNIVPSGSFFYDISNPTGRYVGGLTPDTAYDIYVVLKDGAGNLQAAPQRLDVTTQPEMDTTPDDANSGITGLVPGPAGSRQVTLTVTVQNAAGVALPPLGPGDFRVSINGGSTVRFIDTPPFSGFTDNQDSTYTVVFTGDADETQYSFTNLTVLGVVIEAGPMTVTTPVEEDTTPPSVPENVREIDRTKSSITITWNVSMDASGIAGYDIQMKQGSSGVYSTIGSTDGSVTEFTKTGLDASTTYYFQVRAQDGSSNANISNWSAEISATTRSSGGGGGGTSTPELVIGTANPPDGTVGTAYTHIFTANGGSPSYTFAVTGGALPEGLSIAKNGTLSGTPTIVGAYNYTITVTDSNGRTSPHTFAHVIKEGAPAPAAILQKEIILTVGSLLATMDGQSYTLEVKPFIDAKASRTMVPLRFISEAMGAEVDWQVATRQVIIKDGDKTITLTIDSLNALVNGTPVTLDTAPVIVGNRTFVPLRFISETLGATVDYEASTGRITITR